MDYQNKMPDEQLIQYYLSGDPQSLSTLVTLYKDRIYVFIYNLVQDKEKAEDIFQRVFIRLIDNLMAGKTIEEGNFFKWAMHIARNLCIESNREGGTELLDDSTVAMPGIHDTHPPVAKENNTLHHESHDKIRSMIQSLPVEQREVILLNHYGGVGLKEIAVMMKCNLNAALDTLKGGLQNLRKMMERDWAV